MCFSKLTSSFRMEQLIYPFQNININPQQQTFDDEEEEDYFVHIDVLRNSSGYVSERINTFMIRQDAFDPRRGTNFPTDLMYPDDVDTLKLRGELAGGRSSHYYEF